MTLDAGWPDESKCVVERHYGYCQGVLGYEKCIISSTFNETFNVRRMQTSSIHDKFNPVVERRKGLLRIFETDMKVGREYLATMLGEPIIVTKDEDGKIRIFEAIADD